MKATFKKGVHPFGYKEITKDKPLVDFPTPEKIYIPLSQHIGAPADLLCKVGESVKAGDLIAGAKGFVSSNIYSSVSGIVTAVVKRPNTQGVLVDHIEIANDSKYQARVLTKLEELNAENIILRITEAGIVGMGGATFPTHVKLRPTKAVDTLIINAVECEPYITCDYRLMIEKTEEVVKGAELLKKALGVNRCVIAVEDNKPEAIEKLRNINSGIEIVSLKTKYPQGAEKQLIYSCTKRKVPCGGLPMDIGVVVANIHTAYSVKRAVIDNEPLYKRAMTVSGGATINPGNFMVRNGVPYSVIAEYCGINNPIKCISGGPMMGFAQMSMNASTTKGSSSLLFLTEQEIVMQKPDHCINCAKCSRVCPMHLMPMFIDSGVKNNDLELVKKYGVMNCIECGSCAFICPAKRTLVQTIRLAKKLIREEAKK